MGERGDIPLLPKTTLAAIAVLGIAALSVGLYAENRDAAWLSAHPFTTNLVSSVVGFCAVTFVVGVGFALLTQRATKARSRAVQKLEARTLVEACLLVANQVGRVGEVTDWVPATTPATTPVQEAIERLMAAKDVHIFQFTGWLSLVEEFHADVVLPYASLYSGSGDLELRQSRIKMITNSLSEARRTGGDGNSLAEGHLAVYFYYWADLFSAGSWRDVSGRPWPVGSVGNAGGGSLEGHSADD
ncbi:hypothetical protein ACFQS1_12965 [Paractinoplanes rhizophilus]|uniref:DUF4760 domain-containing protein n=1 Tax=Paractinoplanes rhizophilus TaxID=1416877 RepID=A0ABW2HP72_9ACTN